MRSFPAGLSLRPLATEAEAEACAGLMASTEPWVTLGRTYETSLEAVRDPSREVHVVRVGEEFAGFLVLSLRGAFVGYIQTVCMAPEHRGRGFGSAVIRWAEERIFRESPNVFMCVSSFNRDAFRLYQRLGYSVVGELTDYIVAGHSEILLRKTIGSWDSFRRRRADDRGGGGLV